MAPLFKCVKASDLTAITSAAKAYGKMASPGVVGAAARVAGGQLLQQMQKTMEGESSLAGFKNVAAELTVFEDDDNFVVGIPPGSPAMAQTEAMHGTYQLSDVMQDLAKQAGDIEDRFLSELASAASQ